MERHRLVKKRKPGRPRSRKTHDAILSAAIALTREVGYDAVTMDAIAVRAGAGKATVYRHWKAKETLVAEAIGGIVSAIPAPNSGSTAGDLLRMMRAALAMYDDPATGALLSGLVAAMARSKLIARAVRAGFVESFRKAMRTILARGIASGELRQDTDPELAIDLLSGPLFHRYLLTGGVVDDQFVQDVVRIVLRALCAGSPGPSRRNR